MPRTIIKDAGVWRTISRIYYKDSGVQRAIRRIYKKHSGVWRLVFGDLGGTQSWSGGQSGTWTVPAGVYSIVVTALGGGGGGGYGHESNCEHGGGGGGSGGYQSTTLAVTPGEVISYSVGLGGKGAPAKGGQVATAGGNTSFGAVVSTGGGAGGNPAGTNYFGIGGAAGTPFGNPGASGWGMNGSIQCVRVARGGPGGYGASFPIRYTHMMQHGGAESVYSGGDREIQGIFFSTDGTKMYILGGNQNKAFQHTLSTPWDVSTADYSFKKVAVIGGCHGIAFSSTGHRMFIVDASTEKIKQYALSVNWDVSTATSGSGDVSISVGAHDNSIVFSADGMKVYTSDSTSTGTAADIKQFALTTAWTVTSGMSLTHSISLSNTPLPSGIRFNDTGTRMFVSDLDNTTIFQYDLATPWDVSTNTYSGKSLKIQSDTKVSDFTFSADGTQLYAVGYNSGYVIQYPLASAFDLTLPSTPFGTGGTGGWPSSWTGKPATGLGSGGGGGGAVDVDGSAAPKAGGDGTAGFLRIDW